MMRILALLLFLNIFTANAQIRKICDLKSMPEISGMLQINGKLWALNDGGNASQLYALDSFGNTTDSTMFTNASNVDWEELCTNTSDVFIGDFGNNNGTRKDLRIYKFPVSELGNKNVSLDTISFYYPSQSSFSSNPFTIYDCEAMLALGDSILLFSKSYSDGICRVYSLPNTKGNYAARLIDTLQQDFWVTGASYRSQELILLGYGFNGNLVPEINKITFNSNGFDRQSATQISLNLSYSNQCESLIFENNNTLLIAAEKSNNFDAALYEYKFPDLRFTEPLMNEFKISPNPATDKILVKNFLQKKGYLRLYSDSLQLYKFFEINGKDTEIDVSSLPRGTYMVTFQGSPFDTSIGTLVLR